jgi:hypothetical protein
LVIASIKAMSTRGLSPDLRQQDTQMPVGPVLVAAPGRHHHLPGRHGRVHPLAGTLKHQPGIAAVSAPVPGHGAALISVIPAISPEAAATSTLIGHLRDSVIPAAEHGTTLRAYVGGVTVTNRDFATVIGHKQLLFIAVITGLGFLLLLAFRSLLIPAAVLDRPAQQALADPEFAALACVLPAVQGGHARFERDVDDPPE